MKKWLIVTAAIFALSGAVQAGEEIKLAAAIGSGAAVQPTPAEGAASSTAASTETMTTSNMVTVGVIAAAGLAVVANSDSSSSH